jgi:hypothetical protein
MQHKVGETYRADTHTAPTTANAASTPAARSATSAVGISIRITADSGDDMTESFLCNGLAAHKIPEDLRVLQFEELLERGAIRCGRDGVLVLQVANQQFIEFAHAPATAPAKPGH